VLFVAGVPLDGVALRLPIVVCGLLALAAIPLVTARRVGRPAAYVLAWLVALSPLLVLYGRLVRSYLPMVLLSFCAAAAFEAWWRTGRRRLAAAYVASAAGRRGERTRPSPPARVPGTRRRDSGASGAGSRGAARGPWKSGDEMWSSRPRAREFYPARG
jgi:hypothetical protein